MGFEAFHLKSLGFPHVVVAQKMQESVDHEMGKMLDKSDAEFSGFAPQRLVREGDVAQQAGDRREGSDLGKAQHVGRLVDLSPVAVEDALVGIVGQQDRHFSDARDFRPARLQGLADGTLGNGVEAVGPVAGLDGDGDGQRLAGRGQEALSALSVAPS